MESRDHRLKHNQKRNMQAITMFNYYINILFPTIFQQEGFLSHRPSKYRTINRNNVYNYAYDLCIGEDVDHNTILQAAKNVYVPHSAIEITDHSFFKTETVKLNFLPISATIEEQIDLVILTQDYNSKQFQQKQLKSSRKRSSEFFGQGQTPLTSSTPRDRKTLLNYSFSTFDYFLYVIHYSHHVKTHTTELLWQNFIERYHFKRICEQSYENKCSIIYEAVFVFNIDGHIISLNPCDRMLQNYFNSHFHQKDKSKCLDQLQNTINHLLQTSISKRNETQSASFDPIHRRQLQLTESQKCLFVKLKPVIYQYFGAINKSRRLNRYFLDNLICRMMHNKNNKQDDSIEAIKYYLDFQKRMRTKYHWSHFQKYDRMNIFTYIGKDLMGRPVLLNRMRNLLCSQITDFDEFFDYHFYLFEIYLQDQMEGWVDQFDVIADVSNQVADNTNLSFTKRIIMEGYRLSVDRTYRLIPFDVGFLGYSLYHIVTPLMPQSFVQCVKMFGANRKELLDELRTIMADETIPEFLGGKNPTLETNHRNNNETTSERSVFSELRREPKR